MDIFLVIIGILLVSMISGIFIINKLNINIKIKGINLKYWLIGGSVIIGLITLIVLKIVLGNKNKHIDDLLIQLRNFKSDSDLKLIDGKLAINKDKTDNIDREINKLKDDYGINLDRIEELKFKKEDINKKIEDLNKEYENKIKEKSSIEKAIERMNKRLN